MNKYSICSNCGHYYFLHDGLNNECSACDTPEIKIEDKCPTFQESKEGVKQDVKQSYT